jgi:type II secretory pathway component GspD/PulD (secretin)
MANLTLRHFRASLCFLFAMLFSITAMAATEFKIITLQHRFADELLPIIQPLAGEDGVVTGMQNQLIIRTSPENMAEIEQIIASMDVARTNLKITVNRQNNLDSTQRGVDMSGRKRIGNVAISTNRYPRQARDGVQIDIQNNSSTTKQNNQQFINVVDGEFAFIQVGQSVPFTQEWRIFTHRYTHIQRTTEFIEVSTGFAVRPRSIGGHIELDITPRIAQLNQQGFIDFEALSTVVRVNKGEWFDLGGAMQQNDEVSRAILSLKNKAQTQNNVLNIRVDD